MATPQKQSYKKQAYKKRKRNSAKTQMILNNIPERKYFDTGYEDLITSGTSSMATANFDPLIGTLFAPQQGDDINDRQARSAFVYSIRVQGIIFTNGQTLQTGLDQVPIIRLMMVQDTQTNGTVFAPGQVIQSAPALSQAIFGFTNTAHFGRYIIHKDKFYTSPPYPITSPQAGQIAQGATTMPFKMSYKPKVPIKVNFNALNGGTFADIVDNSFHIIAAAHPNNIDVSNAAQVLCSYKCRVSFTG